MTRIPPVLFLVEAQQRKIHNPQEVKPIGGNRQLPLPFQNVRAVKPDFAEDFARIQPLIGGEQNQIAFLDGQLLCQRSLFGVAEKFHNRRFPFDGSTVCPFSTLI